MSHSPEIPQLSLEEIRSVCRKRIAAQCDRDTNARQLVDKIGPLVAKNVANGRFRRLAAGQSNRGAFTPSDYVDCVILNVRREQDRVDALATGDVAEWNRLLDLLRRRAYSMAARFRPSAEAFVEASDFAQQALAIIFSQPYPFDVAFDAWATTILKNLVLEHYTRSPDVLNRNTAPSSLDAPTQSDDSTTSSLGEMLANPDSLAPFEQVENQSLLFEAISKLRSKAQQKVIVWSFIEQWDDARIARQLGKSRQTVYNLRRRALIRLRDIIRS